MYDLIIIGAGRAGLAAAEAAVRGGAAHVLVIEHDAESPQAADLAADPRVEFWWSTTAVGLLTGGGKRPHTVAVRMANGTARAKSGRVVVATGCYEVPREALRIPGTRPSGVMTPALALDLLEMGLLPGREVVIYGSGTRASKVAERLTHAGGEVVAQLESGRVCRINGYPRLQSVEVETQAGVTETITCDTLVVAVGVRPNVTLFKGTAIDVDTQTHIVRTTADGQTSVEGIYAAGSCVHPDLEHRFSEADGSKVGAAAVR